MYNVSASPHIRSGVTTSGIMRDVALALIPASAFGVYQFGFKAFLILLIAVISAGLAEFLWMRLMKKPARAYECSALVTGLLLGMNLPSTVPLWIPAVGSVFAIIVVKELYGGLGQNFMNPALAARCFLLICFAGRMTSFEIGKGEVFMNGSASVDGLTGATPLQIVKNLAVTDKIADHVSISDMFFGFTGGVIGETSALLIILGGLYLVIRKVISLRIPMIYIAVFAAFILIFGGRGFDVNYLAAELFGGGLMLGAFFMATDYVTSPITPVGQIVFAVILGLLTGIFRVFGASAEGVSYAIIFCNMLVPLIEKFTLPTAFGRKGGK